MRCVGADQPQHRLQQDDRGDAVDVVIAIDQDRFAIANGALDAIAGRTDAVNSGGIVQISERRSDESPVVVLGGDATTDENVSEDRMDGKRDVRGRCGKNPVVVDQWSAFFEHPHFTELLKPFFNE
jgi:hypothetical protein